MPGSCEEQFNHHYEAHLKHLRLKGLQPKTIDAYARAVRRIGGYFDGEKPEKPVRNLRNQTPI